MDDDGEEKEEKEEEEDEDNNHDDDPTGLQILIKNPSVFCDICLSTMPLKTLGLVLDFIQVHEKSWCWAMVVHTFKPSI